jgi:hypothetical protein
MPLRDATLAGTRLQRPLSPLPTPASRNVERRSHGSAQRHNAASRMGAAQWIGDHGIPAPPSASGTDRPRGVPGGGITG